jgi:hypothetical protein
MACPHRGCGKRALEEGWITKAIYNRTVALWSENLDYLKDHQPALINCSPFLWTIYLERLVYSAIGCAAPGVRLMRKSLGRPRTAQTQ